MALMDDVESKWDAGKRVAELRALTNGRVAAGSLISPVSEVQFLPPPPTLQSLRRSVDCASSRSSATRCRFRLASAVRTFSRSAVIVPPLTTEAEQIGRSNVRHAD